MTLKNSILSLVILLGSIVVDSMGARPLAAEPIIIQSTTSTKNAGFYDHILPVVKADTGVVAHVVVVGTGAAIRNAMNCDGDVLLVHSREREDKFVAAGFASRRYDVMYNDFVLVGPRDDPAGIHGGDNILEALRRIAETETIFISRGDNSGTHDREVALWRHTGIDQLAASGKWYRETGSGMGHTINTAIGMGGYTLTDRATWIKFANKDNYVVLVEDEKRLFNPYGVMLVSDAKCPSVNTPKGQAFIDWLVSAKGQATIAAYKIKGKQMFFPNAQ